MRPLRERKMFSGLMSRCIMHWLCIFSSTRSSGAMICMDRGGEQLSGRKWSRLWYPMMMATE